MKIVGRCQKDEPFQPLFRLDSAERAWWPGPWTGLGTMSAESHHERDLSSYCRRESTNAHFRAAYHHHHHHRHDNGSPRELMRCFC